MMLEVTSCLSLLPLPICLAVVGSIVVSIWIFIQSCLNFASDSGPPTLCYKDSSLNDFVIIKCKLKNRVYNPSIWMRSAHVQTVLPSILPRPYVTFDREYLQMKDKGVVALDWVLTPQVKVKRKTPILLIIPPMTEGAVSASAICVQAASRGFKPVVFNRRGSGGSYLTTPKLTSPGDPTDLRQVVVYVKQRLPKAPVAIIAYGTGCGLLLSYLGEFGSSALLAAAVCISPTYDEPARFSTNFRNPYDFLLLLRLKSIIYKHLPALSSVIDVNSILSSWTFHDLSRAVYDPLYKLADSEEYWELNNPMRDVDDISVPILCINSLDDPINASTDIPHDLFKCYPNFLSVITDRGGYCGFLECSKNNSINNIGYSPWCDRLGLDYAEAVIEFTTKSTTKRANSACASSSISRPTLYHSVSDYTNSSSNPLYSQYLGYCGPSNSSSKGSINSSSKGSINSSSSFKGVTYKHQRVNGRPALRRHSSFTMGLKVQRSTL